MDVLCPAICQLLLLAGMPQGLSSCILLVLLVRHFFSFCSLTSSTMYGIVAGGSLAAAAGLYALWPPSPQPSRKYTKADPSTYGAHREGGRISTTLPNEAIDFELPATGAAARPYPHLVEALRQAAQAFPDSPAMMYEKPGYPKDMTGEWEAISWRAYYSRSRRFAKALLARGFTPLHGVVICGFNDPAWMISHMGTVMAHGLSAGCYPTNSPQLCQYVAEHSRSEVAVVDSIKNMEKFLDVRQALPLVKHVVVYAESIPDGVKSKYGDYVLSFGEFLALGDAVSDAALDEVIDKLRVRHCCTLIYTSGTTGNPKAVMTSHDALMFTAVSTMASAELNARDDMHMISYLPLSHIAGIAHR